MINSLLSAAVLTGDEFPWTVVIFAGILIASAALIVFMLLTRRK